jgi:hypothetical protein
VNTPTGEQLSRDFRDLSRQQRERVQRTKAAIACGHVDTRTKLDAALDKLLDAEGFTSHPPVLRHDEALAEVCEREFQQHTGFLDDFEDYDWRRESP